jgi:hypothetical protein
MNPWTVELPATYYNGTIEQQTASGWGVIEVCKHRHRTTDAAIRCADSEIRKDMRAGRAEREAGLAVSANIRAGYCED